MESMTGLATVTGEGGGGILQLQFYCKDTEQLIHKSVIVLNITALFYEYGEWQMSFKLFTLGTR